jgi:hypothetical protein
VKHRQAVSAGTGAVKKIHVCAPPPDRDTASTSGTFSARAVDLPAVHLPLHGDGAETAGPVVGELDERGRHEVQCVGVPQLCLSDRSGPCDSMERIGL